MRTPILFFLALIFLSPLVKAAVPRPGEDEDPERVKAKENYSYFLTTPRHHLRPFHPDRPGSTNTPYTVDAGHELIEIEAVNFSHQSSQAFINLLNYPNFNLRTGVSNSVEIDVAFVPMQTQMTYAGTGKNQTLTGVGDLNLKLKKNMLGNDGGPAAWALMPGLKVPTNTHNLGNKKIEPYFMIPFSVTLKNKWAISLMPELDLRKNAFDDGLHSEFCWPITFGHHLFGILDGYSEFVSRSSNDAQAAWQNYIGTGFTAQVAPESQFDLGVNLGLNAATTRYSLSLGWAVRY